MKVLLTKTGLLKDVSDGYARNYLFPNKLATPATAEVIARNEKLRAEQSASRTAEHDQRAGLAHGLQGRTIAISEKANDTGKLFAAVGPTEIIEAVKKESGFELTTDQLHVSKPIKHLGEHSVTVNLPDIKSFTFTVNVTQQ